MQTGSQRSSSTGVARCQRAFCVSKEGPGRNKIWRQSIPPCRVTYHRCHRRKRRNRRWKSEQRDRVGYSILPPTKSLRRRTTQPLKRRRENCGKESTSYRRSCSGHGRRSARLNRKKKRLIRDCRNPTPSLTRHKKIWSGRKLPRKVCGIGCFQRRRRWKRFNRTAMPIPKRRRRSRVKLRSSRKGLLLLKKDAPRPKKSA